MLVRQLPDLVCRDTEHRTDLRCGVRPTLGNGQGKNHLPRDHLGGFRIAHGFVFGDIRALSNLEKQVRGAGAGIPLHDFKPLGLHRIVGLRCVAACLADGWQDLRRDPTLELLRGGEL